jgi:phosphatidate cytidylyltransferase
VLIAVFIGAGIWEWVRMCGRDHPVFLAIGLAVLVAAGAALIWIDSVAGPFPALWVLGAVWATDIGAYAFGSWLGGPKIAPSISPNKTWAGLAGGMGCAAIWSYALVVYHPSTVGLDGAWMLALAGAATAVVAQTGDFLLSFAKRRFGRKDSSGLIPGHGGVLDRIAGLLTMAPALALLLLVNKDNIRGSW